MIKHMIIRGERSNNHNIFFKNERALPRQAIRWRDSFKLWEEKKQLGNDTIKNN